MRYAPHSSLLCYMPQECPKSHAPKPKSPPSTQFHQASPTSLPRQFNLHVIMATHRDRTPQNKGSSEPRRGRSNLVQEPPTTDHREDSSMSRGRTRRPTDEYTRPPRDQDAYVSTDLEDEDFVYPDSHGGYSPNPERTGGGGGSGGGGRSSTAPAGPSRYQVQMLDEPRVLPLLGEEYLRQRQRAFREQAAQMAREEREAQRWATNRVPLDPMTVVQPRRRRHESGGGSGGGGSHSGSGCCVIF